MALAGLSWSSACVGCSYLLCGSSRRKLRPGSCPGSVVELGVGPALALHAGRTRSHTSQREQAPCSPAPGSQGHGSIPLLPSSLRLGLPGNRGPARSLPRTSCQTCWGPTEPPEPRLEGGVTWVTSACRKLNSQQPRGLPIRRARTPGPRQLGRPEGLQKAPGDSSLPPSTHFTCPRPRVDSGHHCHLLSSRPLCRLQGRVGPRTLSGPGQVWGCWRRIELPADGLLPKRGFPGGRGCP